MLKNGLGELIDDNVGNATRFVDLFSGSGAVAIHVAQRYPIAVEAYDLQQYSAVLVNAVVARSRMLRVEQIWTHWHKRARDIHDRVRFPSFNVSITRSSVSAMRRWCEQQGKLPITQAYGAHYFSPQQAIWLDALRQTLPEERSPKLASLAALIRAASQCAAAPGHTAQPFQPTIGAKKYLVQAWSIDILHKVESDLRFIANTHSIVPGNAHVADANSAAKKLHKRDLVFIDPPYSGVHYSRFYHVLETIAAGTCGEVTGVGRYPHSDKRPRSRYSLKGESSAALDELLCKVAEQKANAILTFPDHECSNGLSGEEVRQLCAAHFEVREKLVDSRFSTMGGSRGDAGGRGGRQNARELILVLKPR